MEAEAYISINVWLSGRSYRLKINPDEEEAVRKAVKLADGKITELRSQYAGLDDQDFLAMTVLTYAVDQTLNTLQNPLLVHELDTVIQKIDRELHEDTGK